VDKGRKSKRKEMTEEEYLEAEQPFKKAKKDKASDKLKIGGSGVPSVQEEAQELDPEAIIGKKTRVAKLLLLQHYLLPLPSKEKEKNTSSKKAKRISLCD